MSATTEDTLMMMDDLSSPPRTLERQEQRLDQQQQQLCVPQGTMARILSHGVRSEGLMVGFILETTTAAAEGAGTKQTAANGGASVHSLHPCAAVDQTACITKLRLLEEQSGDGQTLIGWYCSLPDPANQTTSSGRKLTSHVKAFQLFSALFESLNHQQTPQQQQPQRTYYGLVVRSGSKTCVHQRQQQQQQNRRRMCEECFVMEAKVYACERNNTASLRRVPLKCCGMDLTVPQWHDVNEDQQDDDSEQQPSSQIETPKDAIEWSEKQLESQLIMLQHAAAAAEQSARELSFLSLMADVIKALPSTPKDHSLRPPILRFSGDPVLAQWPSLPPKNT